MFNKKKKKQNNQNTTKQNNNNESKKDTTDINMVSEGTEIIGTLKTMSDIRIAGTIDGEADVKGKVIIAATGHVDGNVNSEDADIAGRVEGSVHANGKLIIRKSAVLQSDLYAQVLEIEEGATVNGSCHMSDFISEEDKSPEDSEKSNTDKSKAV